MSIAAALSVSLVLAQVPETASQPPPAETAASPEEAPAPATEEAAAEAPAEAAPGPAPGPAPLYPEPRFRGIGLITATAVVGGLGLLVNMSRIVLVQRACKADDVVPDPMNPDAVDTASGVSSCVSDLGEYLGLSALAPFVNGAAAGLAGGAGSVRGRWEGWKTAFDGRRRKIGGAYIGAGAGVLGLGVLVYLTTRIALFSDAYGLDGCTAKGDLTGDCVRGRWSGWLGGIALGQSMIVAGSGLLSFGLSYNRTVRMYTPTVRLQIDPIISPTFAGLGLRGRF